MKKNKFIQSFLFGLFLVLIPVSCSQKKAIELESDTLNIILDSYVENGIYPFLYARIEDENDVVYEYSSINHNLLGNFKINGDTWMRIWSMSKLITISLAMDLKEEGLLSLDDPVIKFIPEFSNLKVAVDEDGKSISQINENILDCPHILVETDSIMTIKHLMNHKAGFYYALTNSQCLNSSIELLDIPNLKNGEELIKQLSNLPLIQHPGEKYTYGLNTTVLGLVIQRITGKNLNEMVSERILDTQNIEGLSYRLPENVDLIPCYTGRDGTLRNVIDGDLDIFGQSVPNYSLNNNLFLGGEGMLGTGKGYIDFMKLFSLDNKIKFLNNETIVEMISKPDIENNNYGYNTDYAFYLTSKNHEFEKNILRVGGYEKTSSWIDQNNKLFGVLFAQVNETQDKIGLSTQMEIDFKKELYHQLNKIKEN
jgi:CubicO group peptidase (beta-lactamase class C family)